MKGIKQFAKEMSGIARNKKVLIPVIAVLTVPVLYCAMFLGAFWDPYAKLEELPVAVVNSDQGTVHEGKQLHIGEDFIEKLKEGKHFDYQFVSENEALEGLKSNKYYMAIEVPQDFSKNTATLTTEQPTPAQIRFLPNESYNFLAAQIGNTAIEKMKTELSQEVTKAYTHTVFEQVQTLADGLSKASEGATEIASGTNSAKDGATLLEQNLNKLASGSLTMKSGVNKLLDGSAKLEVGLGDLQKGSTALNGGLTQLSDASGQLSQGAKQTEQGASQLAGGLGQSAVGAAKLEAGATELAAGLEQYAKAHPELAEDEGMQRLIAASKQLAGGLGEAKKGQDQLTAGAAKLKDGTTQLAGGLQQFGGKLNEATEGSRNLAEGAGQLHGGASQLKQGIGDLRKGVGEFADGTGKLDAGAQQMAEGLVKLTDGTGELSSKLSEAAEKTAGLNGSDPVVDMFANPVDLDVVKSNEVPNYGTGFAPYFISLGLFVGALLLYGLGLEVQSLPLFFLFTILTSISFMALIQFLVTVLQHPGRFVAIVILIFQLTSSAGTFPLELIPGWLQTASAWLPMTYSVSGLKAVISSGDYAVMWDNAYVLFAFFAAFAVLTLAYFVIVYRKEYRGSKKEGTALAV